MNNNRNYLCSIDELNLKDYLDDALTNCGLFVAAASGKVGDVNPIKKLYTIEEIVLKEYNNVNVYEHYSDDGVNFSASVSFIKKRISI